MIDRRADDKKVYTPPKKTLTKRGTLLFVDREVFVAHVVVGINPTAQQDVCASTVHCSSHIHHYCIRTAKRTTVCDTSTLLSKKSNVRMGTMSDLRTANVCFVQEEPHSNQGGRRYFSRREITAPVGGPGNMAVYRHVLVLPSTAKVLPPKNKKKRLPPEHYRRRNTAIFCFYRFRHESTAKSRYCQIVPPTLNTAKEYRQLSIPPKRFRQHWIPPKRYRRHWISPKRYRRCWIPPKRYRVHWIPPKKYRLFLCSFFVFCSFWLLGFFFGKTSLWTRDAPAPAHTPSPTPAHTTLSVVQQNNERFRGESQCY